jgi:D-alanyl-D-alanine carboxypeptidase
MTRTALVLVALLLSVRTVPASPQDTRPAEQDLGSLRERLQSSLDDLRSKAEFPGVSVGFVLPDGRSAGAASGYADVENKTPLKPTDRLLAGSVGKMFVAAVVLQLVEEGKIGLDDPVSKWLGREPWFDRLPNSKEMTVRSLLNHTAGVPEYFEQMGFAKALMTDPDKEWSPSDRLAYVLDAKPPFPVGKGWAYSDTHYILAGLVFEKASGKPLFEEIDRRLLKPLQLAGTLASDRQAVPGLANGYASPMNPLGFNGRTIIGGKLMINPQMEWAGGGLATTPEDLARWAKALFEGKIVKNETLQAMLTSVDMPGGGGKGKVAKYGLGVMIRESEWGPSYGHGGWFPGYRTEVVYFPNKKVAIAVQFNTDAGKSLKKRVMAYIGDVARVVIGPGK